MELCKDVWPNKGTYSFCFREKKVSILSFIP